MNGRWKPETIVSGGQTGVDRAALDTAIKTGVNAGGWCPKGRLSEDGRLSDIYPLQETPSKVYTQRTEWNVRDSDGTLIITCEDQVLTGGTAYTQKIARKLNKPCCIICLDSEDIPELINMVVSWAEKNSIKKLNVAGPRESGKPGVYVKTCGFLKSLLE